MESSSILKPNSAHKKKFEYIYSETLNNEYI